MPKGAYIGINNVARKIKKGYIGVNGVARKIKKAYIGIGGVARPFWGSEELAYYGTITNLSEARSDLAATHNNNYALFGGGRIPASGTLKVDSYNSSLVRSNATSLKYGYSSSYTGTHIGNYAVFRTGEAISVYNQSLTQTITTTANRCDSAASCNGNYVLFTDCKIIECFNSSFTLTSTIDLGGYYHDLATTHIGNYALFGGGFVDQTTSYNTVYVINKSCILSNPVSLSVARSGLAATHIGNYALFGGGVSSYNSNSFVGNPKSTVDVINTSFTRTIPTGLSVARYHLAATHIGDYALFGGGMLSSTYGNETVYSTVDCYSTSLTRTIPTGLSVARKNLAATHIGDYALFAGGNVSNINYSSTVDVYTLI